MIPPGNESSHAETPASGRMPAGPGPEPYGPRLSVYRRLARLSRPEPPGGSWPAWRSWGLALMLGAVALVGSGHGAPAEAGGPVAGQTPASPVQEGQERLWPLTLADRFLTSNFMEYRGGRFHAGIDLKTDERSGFPVRAPEAGRIVRLRAAPDGYGRAVYLQGESGYTYVLGHLERFADRLRGLVRSAQGERGSYRVDLAVSPAVLEVARGEVLGLSGQSGTIGPHLHLEVRGQAQEPLDPLAHGFGVPDTIAPLILSVRAMPAAADARVEGGMLARSVADAAGLRGELPPLHVQGAVAFCARIEERSDRMAHRLQPYEIVVRLDGREVMRRRNERFRFDQNGMATLEWLDLPGVREVWLHQREGDRLDGRQGGEWYRSELTPGSHRIELSAADRRGNRTDVNWLVEVAGALDDAGDLGTQEGTDTPSSPQRLPAGWREAPARVRLPAPAGGERWLTPFLVYGRDGDGSWWSRPPRAAAVPPGVRSAGAAEGDPAPDGPAGGLGWLLEPGPDRPLLAATVLWVFPDPLSGAQLEAARTVQGLVPVGRAWQLAAADWPAAGLVTVPWPGGAPAPDRDDVAVYCQAPDSTWRWVGRLEEERGARAATLASDRSGPEASAAGASGASLLALPGPGRYALFRDTVAPVLGPGLDTLVASLSGEAADPAVSPPRWQVLVAPVLERGSGFEPDSCRAWLDGRPFPPEPDPVRDRLLIELPDDTAAGHHRLELEIMDRTGNRARRHLPVVCRGP
jgi:hypothetical protein